MELYRRAVALVLSATALLKFVAILRHERLLEQTDPLTRMPMSQLTLAAALIEVFLAVFVLTYKRSDLVLIAIHVCAWGFVGYHGAMIASGNLFCPCLGGGVSWWPWLGLHQTEASMAMALWLWISTFVLLLPTLRKRFSQ